MFAELIRPLGSKPESKVMYDFKISMAFVFTFLLFAQLPTRVKIFFTHMRMSTPTLSRPWLTFTEAHLKIMYRKLFLRFLQYYLAIYHA